MADGAPRGGRDERRRFTRRRWARRLRGWRAALAATLALVLVGAGVWLVGWSDVLDVEGVEVAGATDTVTPDQVRRAAAVEEGEPLARVDLDAIRSRVESLAAVREADVSREWPDAVRVSVVEREAVALVEIGGVVRGMDVDGVAFRRYEGEVPPMPRVETDSSVTAEALREAARVVVAMPAGLAERVEAVRVDSVDAITLSLRDGRTVRWGSAESSEQKSSVLAVMLRQEALTYDVSVPSDPTYCTDPACA
jgi:cell division protein FtsQ